MKPSGRRRYLLLEENEYSIIITRAPLDVLRMADHYDNERGVDITSCHSPASASDRHQGLYYQCAVDEADAAGLVAYVVENEELNNAASAGMPPDAEANKELFLDKDEIFADSKRGVEGIMPVSRLRLRKYVYEPNGQELAVPELRLYGKRIPEFAPTLRKWALDTQQKSIEAIAGERGTIDPDLDNFPMSGGR